MEHTLQMTKEEQDWISGLGCLHWPSVSTGSPVKGQDHYPLRSNCLFMSVLPEGCRQTSPPPGGGFILTKWAIQVQLPGSNSTEKLCENFSKDLETRGQESRIWILCNKIGWRQERNFLAWSLISRVPQVSCLQLWPSAEMGPHLILEAVTIVGLFKGCR